MWKNDSLVVKSNGPVGWAVELREVSDHLAWVILWHFDEEMESEFVAMGLPGGHVLPAAGWEAPSLVEAKALATTAYMQDHLRTICGAAAAADIHGRISSANYLHDAKAASSGSTALAPDQALQRRLKILGPFETMSRAWETNQKIRSSLMKKEHMGKSGAKTDEASCCIKYGLALQKWKQTCVEAFFPPEETKRETGADGYLKYQLPSGKFVLEDIQVVSAEELGQHGFIDYKARLSDYIDEDAAMVGGPVEAVPWVNLRPFETSLPISLRLNLITKAAQNALAGKAKKAYANANELTLLIHLNIASDFLGSDSGLPSSLDQLIVNQGLQLPASQLSSFKRVVLQSPFFDYMYENGSWTLLASAGDC